MELKELKIPLLETYALTLFAFYKRNTKIKKYNILLQFYSYMARKIQQ